MVAEQEDGFSIKTKQYKKVLYCLSSQLINNTMNNKLYYLFVTIQLLQILGYQCHEVYLYKGWGSNQFRTLTQFINPEYYLKHSILMNVIIPISTVIVIIHTVILGYCFRQEQHSKNAKDKHVVGLEESKKSFIYPIGHWYTVIFTTILTTPVFLSSLLVFYCHQQSPYHQNRQCYNTYHIFLIMLSIINIVWTIVINIYYALFYYTYNPFMYENVFALSSPLFNVLKIILKVVPPAYFIFDQTLEYSILFVFGIAAGLLGYIAISRILYPYRRYNLRDDRVILNIEIISTFISIMFILQAFYNQQQGFMICFIISFIVPFPIANSAYRFALNNRKKSVLAINQFKKENTQNIQKLIIEIIVQLQDRTKQMKDKKFLKVIKLHNEECENISCSCHQYLDNYSIEQNTQSSDDQQKQLIYKVIIEIIDNMLEVNKKAYSLIILKSYIEFYQFKNIIKAAFTVSKILQQKINFFQTYMIYAFLHSVTKTYRDMSNIETYRLFSEHLMLFQQQMIKLAQNYAQFWQQLSQQNSSLKKIMNLMKSTKKSKQIIHQQFQVLQSIYPSNYHVLDIYKELFKQVLIDYEQFIKYNSLYEDNKEDKKQGKLVRSDVHIKFNPNQDLIVINTSVNLSHDIFHGGCEIISVTNNLHKVLGYSTQYLIGKNINRFLPKIYTEFHDEIITNYLNKKDSQLKTRELPIFPLNSNGNLVECTMVAKIMPSLQYGVNIVSFLLNSNKSQQNLIIYDQRTGLVDSMSEKAENLLLGKKAKKNAIQIPDHINDILPSWDYINERINSSRQQHSKQILTTFSDIHLYRSDGPKQNKYVKIVAFQLEFQTNMFTLRSMQSNPMWLGFQTLVENTQNQNKIIKDSHIGHEIETKNEIIAQNVNPILKKLIDSMQKAQQIQQKMYISLKKWYPKVYIAFQIICTSILLGLIIWNYIGTLSYYSSLKNDILIKQNIADCQDLVMQSAHTASHYVFSGGDAYILSQASTQNASLHLKQLQLFGQFIYQQIVKKQVINEFAISDLMLNVSYYSSANNAIIKQQTVTDASYQLVLYLIEVYNNTNPARNLPNNIQFVFRNCLNITDQFDYLNAVFTQNLLKNNQNRKSFLISLIASIMALFFVGIIWQLIYKIVIISKVNDVIKLYQYVPTAQLQKFPIKCENFVKYVCPIAKDQEKDGVKDIWKNDKKLQKLKDNKQQYQQVQQEQQIQYVSFSSNLSIKQILIQTIGFVAFFSILFIVHLTWQNSVIDGNFSQVTEWNRISKYKSEIIQMIYIMNEYKNRAQQWNTTELFGIKGRFNASVTDIEILIKETTALDSYMSSTFQLLEQSVYILNSHNVTSQQFILNQHKLEALLEIVDHQQIHQNIQPNIASKIYNFLSILQLIFIGQIIIFLLYAILYLPKSYVNYIQKNQIAQLMYDTLGYKLQNIAYDHSKIK